MPRANHPIAILIAIIIVVTGFGVIDSRAASSSDVARSFPEGVTITATLPISELVDDRIVLIWRPTYGASSTVVPATIETGGDGQVTATATLDFQQQFVPAGVSIDYRWHTGSSPFEPISEPESFEWSDTRWDWRSETGDLVTVHTYGDGTTDASTILASATATLDTMRARYGIELIHPVHIWAYPSMTDFAGTRQENSREAVAGVAYPEYGVISAILPVGRPAEVDRVIPHEIAHQALAQVTANPWNHPPLWFDEGLATFLQTGGTTSHERILERVASEGTFFKLDSLTYAFPYDPADATLAYAQSWSVVRWLHETYGDDGVARLIAAFGTGVSWDEAIGQALGTDIASIEREWGAWIQERAPTAGARLFTVNTRPHRPKNDTSNTVVPQQEIQSMAVENRQQHRAEILDPAAIERKLALNTFNVDSDRAHIRIIDHQTCLSCVRQQCINCCPANCYAPQEDGTVLFSYEGCVECGTCRIVCNVFDNIEWTYPRGGFGVQYRLG